MNMIRPTRLVRVRTLQVGWQISFRQEWQECEVAGTNRYKLATWKFYYCLKWSCYLQNIFVNPCEFLGLCWVAFRSRNFADAKRKEVVCITLGFFPNSASGNGIWALGSGISKKKMGWEMGLVTPLQDPRVWFSGSRALKQGMHFRYLVPWTGSLPGPEVFKKNVKAGNERSTFVVQTTIFVWKTTYICKRNVRN